MKTTNPGAEKMRNEVAAWIARQTEPFGLSEISGRFGIPLRRVQAIARRLVADGVVRQVSPSRGTVPAMFEATR